MHARQFQFVWDEAKAVANVRKHGVPFELARTVFNDPRLLTVADLEHSDIEDRWFSTGCASNSATFGRQATPSSAASESDFMIGY